MKIYTNVIAALLVLAPAPDTSIAADDALVCKASRVVNCEINSTCVSVTQKKGLEDIVLTFLPSTKQAIVKVGDSTRPPSRINSINAEDQVVTLTGSHTSRENENKTVHWVAVINKAAGSMTLSATQDGLSLVVFGRCSKREQ